MSRSGPSAKSDSYSGRRPRWFDPPAASFDDENETTHVFDKDRHALDAGSGSGAAAALVSDDETTRVFDKDKSADEDVTTHVFDQARHAPRVLPVRPGSTKIGLGVPKPPAVKET